MQAASIVTDELRSAIASGPPQRALDENIIEPSDPRQAAARAAWRALTGRQEPSAERRFVSLSVHPAERAAFANLAERAQRARDPPGACRRLKLACAAEAGQGELWLLVGSPCGIAFGREQRRRRSERAGRHTGRTRADASDVKLEAVADGGRRRLALAHAAREPGETAAQQAERVARALGRSLTERDASGDALATAQSELFAAVGGAPRPAYARLLDALSPDHTAWLEPRGSFASLAQANRDSVAARGRDLLRGPLRVAVLGNQDEAQATASRAQALER